MESRLREHLEQIYQAALEAVDPGPAVRRALSLSDFELRAQGRTYNLRSYRHIFLVGVGKASVPMAEALLALFPREVHAGVLVTRDQPRQIPGMEVLQTGHPIPDRRGLAASEKIIDLLKQITHEDLLVLLLSGGGFRPTPRHR